LDSEAEAAIAIFSKNTDLSKIDAETSTADENVNEARARYLKKWEQSNIAVQTRINKMMRVMDKRLDHQIKAVKESREFTEQVVALNSKVISQNQHTEEQTANVVAIQNKLIIEQDALIRQFISAFDGLKRAGDRGKLGGELGKLMEMGNNDPALNNPTTSASDKADTVTTGPVAAESNKYAVAADSTIASMIAEPTATTPSESSKRKKKHKTKKAFKTNIEAVQSPGN
jgi:hypothetical protein